MPALVAPTVAVRPSFLAAMAEFHAEGRTGDGSMVGTDLARWSDVWDDDDGFARYVDHVRADAVPDSPRPAGHVPCTTLWWVEGDDYLGRLAVRHVLTDALREHGGHIGYDVRASARRRGHATAMLRAALPLAHGLGIDPVLVTCDHDNVASRRVIEHAGGVMADRRGDKLRFWVPTGLPAPARRG